MGGGLRGHAPEMIKEHSFVKKDPTTPQHFIIWAVYTTYAQHQRPPQPYFTSFHGTHSTSGKVETFSLRTYRRRPRSLAGAQWPSRIPASSAALGANLVGGVRVEDRRRVNGHPATHCIMWTDAARFTCRRQLGVRNHMCASACTVAWGGGRPRLRCTGV